MADDDVTPTVEDVEALADLIAPALYEAVMDATADQWTRWEHLTDFKREPYIEEARLIAASCEPVLAHVRAEALREASLDFGFNQPMQIWLRDRADAIERGESL